MKSNNSTKQPKKANGGKQQPQKKKQKPKARDNPGRMLSGEATSVASAYAKGVRGNKPRIDYSNNGRECRVVHREFVSNVTGSVAFATPIQLALNPGLSATFPWLANIANNFEQYRVNRLVAKYLTRTGTNVPGSILLYPDYDAADAAPVSEQIASNYQEVCEDAPWKDISCALRIAGMHAIGPKKFVRAEALANNLDIKTYDVGTLFLSTVDGTTVSWGKLWLEYDISFFEPQLNPAGAPIFLGGSVTGAPGGSMTPAAPFGTAATVDAQNRGFTFAGQVMTFTTTGTITASVQVTGTGLASFTPTAGSGAVILGSAYNINGGLTIGFALFSATVVPGSTITFGSTGATVTACILLSGTAPTGSLL
jgi:hypothetical protein